MRLNQLLEGVTTKEKIGDMDIDITNIHSDSRKIKENALFVAIDGFTSNGIDYIDSAIKNGAIAIIVEPNVDVEELHSKYDMPIITVDNTRKTLAIISSNLYGNPSKKIKLVGITGTKGKTTSTFMVKSILQAHGLKVGLIGSIGIFINDEQIEETDRTTPESIDIQRLLAYFVEQGVDVAVIETSSQAMKLYRVYCCDFEVGLFTNLTEDHISPKEHPDMEDYFNCKLKLLEMAKQGVINNDDPKVASIKNLLPEKELRSFSIDNPSDYKVDPNSLAISDTATDFTIMYNGKPEKIECAIPGKFTVYNAAGAITVASYFDVTADEIREALNGLMVLGRSELVPNKLGLTIMLDYAHTPSSLESILTAVRSYAKKRVICAWGVGGNRDSKKRPIMGEISGRLADYTILMSDQVRYEDPLKILQDIEVGLKPTGKPYKIIVDRTEGIKYALEMAEPGDIIVIPGLGHDMYLEKNGVKYPYNEREVISKLVDEILEERKN